MTSLGRALGVVVPIVIVWMTIVSANTRQTRATIPSAPNVIAGTVTSSYGPEAGVWVIAETHDLPTVFARIVVTDEQGRYVVPNLPEATYDVWVRGYGLVDSPRVQGTPGASLDLSAVVAPTPRAAADYYPANYWYSLLQPPASSEFPGTGPQGNGVSQIMRNQAEWIDRVSTTACTSCHQMGDKATREFSEYTVDVDHINAWDQRVQVGQNGPLMSSQLTQLGRRRALQVFADWTSRIEAGEVPPSPPRPQGIERNVVLTEWEWADDRTFIHDMIASDRRDPTVNAKGPVFSIGPFTNDYLNVVDPTRHTSTRVQVPSLDPNTSYRFPQQVGSPSYVWGEEPIFQGKVGLHSPIMDRLGRLWFTGTGGGTGLDWCESHSSSELYPMSGNWRQLTMYDPSTQTFTLVRTCFGQHHLFFAEDEDDTLWFSGGGQVLSWFKTRTYDATRDEQAAQGWMPFVLDSNGNGRRDAWVEPDVPLDATKDLRVNFDFIYGVMPNSVDGSVWVSNQSFPGFIARVDTKTGLTEKYAAPFGNPDVPVEGYTPRGLDIDRHGVVWTGLSGSGHLASFDRRKCKAPLAGPDAVSGQHCPEGWTLYAVPGPQFTGANGPAATDAIYYNWVDQFDAFGLGKNTPMATGANSDALLALSSGNWVVLRVPYPMGMYTRLVDGRIDDPTSGWQGRGLWATYSSVTPWHQEGGRGVVPRVVHFQLRPDPLAH